MPAELFLIHGWNMPSSVWDRLESSWPSSTSIVRGVLPGYSADVPEPDVEQDIDRLVADHVDALLDQAPQRAIWCGWSLGATLAMAAALHESTATAADRRISGLALLAPTPCFIAKPDWELGIEQATFDQLIRLIRRRYTAGTKQFLKLQLPVENRLSAAPELICDPPLGENTLNAGHRVLCEYDCRSNLESLKIPALVVSAKVDRVVPPAASQWLAQQLPVANHNTIGEGHLFPWYSANELANRISEFARRLEQGV